MTSPGLIAGSSFTKMPSEGNSDFVLCQFGGWNRQGATTSSFHGSWPVGSGISIFRLWLTSMRQSRVYTQKGIEVDRIWQISFLDPGEGRDDRITEADPELPKIGDLLTRDTLWGDIEGMAGAPQEVGVMEATFSAQGSLT